jgi:hypothetical protein
MMDMNKLELISLWQTWTQVTKPLTKVLESVGQFIGQKSVGAALDHSDRWEVEILSMHADMLNKKQQFNQALQLIRQELDEAAIEYTSRNAALSILIESKAGEIWPPA